MRLEVGTVVSLHHFNKLSATRWTLEKFSRVMVIPVALDTDWDVVPAVRYKLGTKPEPDFYQTEPLMYRGLAVFKNGIFVRCSGCNKKIDPTIDECANCHSTDKEPEILVGVNFADGLGGRLRTKMGLQQLQGFLSMSEDELLDAHHADETLQVVSKMKEDDKILYSLYISQDGNFNAVESYTTTQVTRM